MIDVTLAYHNKICLHHVSLNHFLDSQVSFERSELPRFFVDSSPQVWLYRGNCILVLYFSYCSSNL